VHPLDLPYRPETLELQNICEDPSAVPQELIYTIGLYLGYGVALPLKEENPIDFERLRRSIRIQCEKNSGPEEEYNPKLYKRSDYEPKAAPDAVEDAINDFEEIFRPDYNICKKHRQPTTWNDGESKCYDK